MFCQDNIEVVKAENGILRRKLQSKTEGLMIISKEVETLKNELNQTKTLNEHLMNPVRTSKTLVRSPLTSYDSGGCF